MYEKEYLEGGRESDSRIGKPIAGITEPMKTVQSSSNRRDVTTTTRNQPRIVLSARVLFVSK